MTSPHPVASILERLATVPEDVDVSLVIRHAEREEIPAGTYGYDVILTDHGRRTAKQLGTTMSEKRMMTVISSPVPRCVHTAQQILHGAGSSSGVVTDRRLGDSGAFMIDPEIAGPLFLEVSIPEIARRQLQDDAPPPGMRPTNEGVSILLDLVASYLNSNGQLNVFVAHDVILGVLVGSIFRLSVEQVGWPAFLEGLLLWRRGGRLHCSWRQISLSAMKERDLWAAGEKTGP